MAISLNVEMHERKGEARITWTSHSLIYNLVISAIGIWLGLLLWFQCQLVAAYFDAAIYPRASNLVLLLQHPFFGIGNEIPIFKRDEIGAILPGVYL